MHVCTSAPGFRMCLAQRPFRTLITAASSTFARFYPQIQSNALAALEAIDLEMAQSIMEEGCVTGDRINGLCDGVTGDW